MKQDNRTTRELAIEWWNKHISLGKTKLCDTHTEIVGNIRRWETLTENEIEAIYLSENPEQPAKEVVERTKSLLSGDEWATEPIKEESSNSKENKLYQWVRDKYPPIDLNQHYKSVIELVNQNARLKERIEVLEGALNKIIAINAAPSVDELISKLKLTAKEALNNK